MSLFHLLMAVFLTARGVTAASSVALSDFVPRIDSLTSPCLAVYNQAIGGCVAEDFDAAKQRCSADCVQGLVQVSQQINKVCSMNDVSETSIIGVFLLGQGIPILCQGVSVTTIGAESSTTSSTSTSSTNAVATSTQEARSSSAATASTPVTSAASTPTSTLTTTLSTLTEAAPTSSAAAQPSFMWSLPATQPSQTPSSQKSNSDSGGGSPFDVVATGSSTQSQPRSLVSLMSAILGMIILLCVAT